MYKYKIVLNGQGGYFFCALLNISIIDFWINNKSIELLQEYILAHYLNDENIDEEWRIPNNYRFNIFDYYNLIFDQMLFQRFYIKCFGNGKVVICLYNYTDYFSKNKTLC